MQRDVVCRKLAPSVAPLGERRPVRTPGAKLHLPALDPIFIDAPVIAEIDRQPSFGFRFAIPPATPQRGKPGRQRSGCTTGARSCEVGILPQYAAAATVLLTPPPLPAKSKIIFRTPRIPTPSVNCRSDTQASANAFPRQCEICKTASCQRLPASLPQSSPLPMYMGWGRSVGWGRSASAVARRIAMAGT
jgi:hypothetical protein